MLDLHSFAVKYRYILYSVVVPHLSTLLRQHTSSHSSFVAEFQIQMRYIDNAIIKQRAFDPSGACGFRCQIVSSVALRYDVAFKLEHESVLSLSLCTATSYQAIKPNGEPSHTTAPHKHNTHHMPAASSRCTALEQQTAFNLLLPQCHSVLLK
jgi:hypothetical protein